MPKSNIVWITIDSLRPDHLPLTGYTRNSAPNLTDIASSEQGQWTADCIAQGHWTPAASASILTGCYLSTHGLGVDSPNAGQLPGDVATVPQLLGDVGYTTGCVSTNAYFSSGSGLNRGFDKFEYLNPSDLHRNVGISSLAKYLLTIRKYGGGLSLNKTLHNRSLFVKDLSERWLREFSESTDPFFLYLHYNSTHYPYTPPRWFLSRFLEDLDVTVREALELSQTVYENPYRQIAEGCQFSETQWEILRALYDAEIAYVDHLIGETFDYLVEEVDSDTILVITGDHGELFGEEMLLGHHITLHDAIMTVPLITYNFPCEFGTGDLVQHIDVTKTLLEYVGAGTDQCEGTDLTQGRPEVGICQRGPRPNDFEAILSHNSDFDTSSFAKGHVTAARTTDYKLVVDSNGCRLYSLPDESTDISDEDETVTQELLSKVPDSKLDAEQWRGVNRSQTFDNELRDRLSAMGYI